MPLSPLLQEGIDILGAIKLPDIRAPELSGVKVSEESILCQYNIALRNHSASFQLEQASEGGPLLMHGKLFGQARTRWSALSSYLNVLSQAGVLQLREPPELNGQQLLFTWVLDSPEKIQWAREEFTDFLTYSMEEAAEPILQRMIERADRRGVIAQMGRCYFISLVEDGVRLLFAEKFIQAWVGKDLLSPDEFVLMSRKALSANHDIRLFFVHEVLTRAIERGLYLVELCDLIEEPGFHDNSERERSIFWLEHVLFKKIKSDIEEGKEMDRALTIATKMSRANHYIYPENETQLFTQFVRKNLYLEEALSHVKRRCLFLQKQEQSIISPALNDLLNALIKMGYLKEIKAFSESIQKENKDPFSFNFEEATEGISIALKSIIERAESQA